MSAKGKDVIMELPNMVSLHSQPFSPLDSEAEMLKVRTFVL